MPPLTEQFKDTLRRWRGKLRQKEAASILDVPVATYRKWEIGKRTPKKLTQAEVVRRMADHPCVEFHYVPLKQASATIPILFKRE